MQQVMLFFLAILPFLSEGLRKLGQKLHAQCCIVMFVIGGLLNFIPGSSLNIGNNVLGFMYVWILFSYYRWYMERVTVKAAGIIAVTGLVVVLFWNTLMAFFWRGDGGLQSMFSEPVGRIWSLPVLMISFGLFSLCSEITFHNRAINAVASAAFGGISDYGSSVRSEYSLDAAIQCRVFFTIADMRFFIYLRLLLPRMRLHQLWI
ncbi:hypothetical protein [Bifidobacterium adolescentis]|uniref:hypothetical protein n=1 Tax=Bifidobacterium adolescentis TaxID=1680 RepID=UPI001177FFDD|nr:hypothetical protein [Bifidobacterium adolescentis]